MAEGLEDGAERRKCLGRIQRAAADDDMGLACELAQQSGLADSRLADDDGGTRLAKCVELVGAADERPFGSARLFRRDRRRRCEVLPSEVDERAADAVIAQDDLAGRETGLGAQRLCELRCGRCCSRFVLLVDEDERKPVSGERVVMPGNAVDDLGGPRGDPVVLLCIEVERNRRRDDERGRRATCARAGRPAVAASPKRLVLVQHRTLELAQSLAGLEAELVAQIRPRLAERLERIRLPARAVESEHQLLAPPFARRLGRDECCDLAHEVSGVSGCERRVDPLLLRQEAELHELGDLAASELVECDVRIRRAAPQPKRLVDAHRRARRLGRCEVGGFGDQAPEPNRIDRSSVDVEHVAGRLVANRRVGSERAAEAGDRHLERVPCIPRRILGPERFDQRVGGDDRPDVDEERGEQRAHPCTAEGQRGAVAPNLDRTENTELERHDPGTRLHDRWRSATAGSLRKLSCMR